MKKEIIEHLIQLVMNERQAKIYYALLKNNSSTASELHRLSGVALSKTYENLKYLNINGFCTKSSDGSNNIKYSPTDPMLAFQDVIQQKKKQVTDTETLQNNLDKIYKSKPSQGDLSQYLEVVHGNRNVHKRFIELLNNAKHTVHSIARSPYSTMSQKENEEQHQAAKNFLARGGIDISITQMNENSPLFTFNNLRFTMKNYKPEYNKFTYNSPIKLFIFDSETLMTFNETFVDSNDEICASIIKQPTTVDTYIHMFNYLFEQAMSGETWLEENKELFERKLKEFDESISKKE